MYIQHYTLIVVIISFFSNAMDGDNFEKLIIYSFYGLIKLTSE